MCIVVYYSMHISSVDKYEMYLKFKIKDKDNKNLKIASNYHYFENVFFKY